MDCRRRYRPRSKTARFKGELGTRLPTLLVLLLQIVVSTARSTRLVPKEYEVSEWSSNVRDPSHTIATYLCYKHFEL